VKILIVPVLLTLLVACSEKEQEPVTKSGLTREQVMEMAVKNRKGEVSDEELKAHGISIGEPIENDAAKEMLIKELEALEEQEETTKE